MKMNEQCKQIAIQMIDNDEFEFTNNQISKIVCYQLHKDEPISEKDLHIPDVKTDRCSMFDNVQVGGFSIELPDKHIEEQMSIDDFKGKRKFSTRTKDRRQSEDGTVGSDMRMLRKTIYQETQRDFAKRMTSMFGNKTRQIDVSDIELNKPQALKKYKNEIVIMTGRKTI